MLKSNITFSQSQQRIKVLTVFFLKANTFSARGVLRTSMVAAVSQTCDLWFRCLMMNLSPEPVVASSTCLHINLLFVAIPHVWDGENVVIY